MSTVRRLLAFDTAGSACSAAVWVGGEIVAHRAETMVRGHSERILPMIRSAMAEAGLSFGDLDGLAVTTGPGTFTGLRIGLATARGLALAGRLPLLGLSNFDAIAGAVEPDEASGRLLVAVLDSKRADVYVQCFSDPTTPCSPALSVLPGALDRQLPTGPLVLAGDAIEQVRSVLVDSGRDVEIAASVQRTDSAVVARLAAAVPQTEWHRRPLRPLYLRAPDVTRPRPLRARSAP